MCQGRLCDKDQKCENGPNLPLGSLEVLIVENQAQNSKCIMNKRLMVLWQERIKMLITKVQKKPKNITGLEIRPTVTEKRKLREVERKRGKVPLYPIFPSLRFKIVRMFLAQWVFALKFQLYGKNVVQQVWNFDPQLARREYWERLWGREGRFPCIHISTPKLRNCEIVD